MAATASILVIMAFPAFDSALQPSAAQGKRRYYCGRTAVGALADFANTATMSACRDAIGRKWFRTSGLPSAVVWDATHRAPADIDAYEPTGGDRRQCLRKGPDLPVRLLAGAARPGTARILAPRSLVAIANHGTQVLSRPEAGIHALVRDVLATHILKQTGSYEQASYATQDTPDMVAKRLAASCPKIKLPWQRGY
ncbi:hypothetical protein MesoLj131b_07810 [Mesorhizobium sp. 131-2-5]|nr:hypothetical protein MesoLj131b_07810 [Mesorhizobium sp. 131-2-5]